MIFFIIAIDDFVLVKKIEPKWQKNFFNFSFTMHHRNDVCRMIGLQKKSICFSANSCFFLKKKRKRRFRFFGRKKKKTKWRRNSVATLNFCSGPVSKSIIRFFFVCVCVCVCVCNNKNNFQPTQNTHTRP